MNINAISIKKFRYSVLLAVLVCIVILPSCKPAMDACFTYSPEVISPGTTVTFNASCSEGTSVYVWDFGNNTYDTLVSSPTITHTFSSEGTYTVVLEAGEKCGTYSFLRKKGDSRYTQTIIVK